MTGHQSYANEELSRVGHVQKIIIKNNFDLTEPAKVDSGA
jgi:hypothetical protein